jgi:hypothetical protein
MGGRIQPDVIAHVVAAADDQLPTPPKGALPLEADRVGLVSPLEGAGTEEGIVVLSELNYNY